MSEKYNWKFSTIGGITRVSIETGEDIAHLEELDKKLWTVLSCPVKGIEFCEETLKLMDTDSDGKIRAGEVIAASKWICGLIDDPELLISQSSVLSLSSINRAGEEGEKLYNSSKQILANLGLEKDEISVADTSDSVAIFSKTRFNGDGVITLDTAIEPEHKGAMEACMASVGSVTDRSGNAGVNAALVNEFYTALSDYEEWVRASENGRESIFPFGDATQAAYDCCMGLDTKMKDFFMRCHLSRFNGESTGVLDVRSSKIEDICDKDLSQCSEEIARYPLARVNPQEKLYLEQVNPAWQAAVETLRKLVLEPLGLVSDHITEALWEEILSKFAAFTAWKSSKKGEKVESLGVERVRELLEQNSKDALLALIDEDLKLVEQANSIDAVRKLLLFYRDIYKLIRNFVTFQDFYSRKNTSEAVFMAGRLYIEQRSCDLCVKVTDMGKQNAMAAAGGMYLLYCDCVKTTSNQNFTIVAVVTDGDINDLKVGANGVFYDRAGMDWDATVTKIVDNPISLRQGFWQPYRKFGQFVENQINKIATNMDNKVTNDATGKIAEVSTKVETAQVTAPADSAPAEGNSKKSQAFDIAKFCGIFAAIGMALGYIGSFLTAIASGFLQLEWWQMILVIPGIMLIISLPSMVLAWLKIRKRSLSPILTANGWAINSQAKINIAFGSTLTQLAKFPTLKSKALADPFSDKKPLSKRLKWWLLALVVLAAAAVVAIKHWKSGEEPVQEEEIVNVALEAVQETVETFSDAIEE